MKIFTTTILAALMLLSARVHADFSGEVALLSDYRYNGISNTSRGPALQIGITFEADSGLYLHSWASNVKFAKDDPEDLEWDFFLGYYYEINDHLGVDAGVAYYTYYGGMGASDSNYFEYYVGFTIYTNTTVYLHYSEQYFGTQASHYFLKVNHDIPVGNYVFSVAAAQNESNNFSEYAWTKNGTSYQYLEVAAAGTWADVTVKATLSATTINSGENKKNAGPALVVGVSYSF